MAVITTEIPLVAMVDFKQDGGNQYAHVVTHVQTLDENGEPRGFSDYQSNLYQFQIWSQMDPSNDQVYAIEAAFDAYRVDLENAERMAKILRFVQNRLDKMRQEFGYAETYGQFMIRVLKIIGVKKVLLCNPQSRFGEKYSTYEKLGPAADAVDYRIKDKLANWADKKWTMERY